MVTPNMSAATSSTVKASTLPGWATSQTDPPTKTSPSTALRTRAPGKTIGLPEMMPCSLAAAMIDPVNVTAPITMSRAPGTVTAAPTGLASALNCRYSTANRTAAPPPTALKMLTSCGIAVMATDRARYSPTAEPVAAPHSRTIHPVASIAPSSTSRIPVDTIATAMAVADSKLPRRAVAGEFMR